MTSTPQPPRPTRSRMDAFLEAILFGVDLDAVVEEATR